MSKSIVALHFLALATIAHAQVISTWPHVYPNEPKGDYSPAWQNCQYSTRIVNAAISNLGGTYT